MLEAIGRAGVETWDNGEGRTRSVGKKDVGEKDMERKMLFRSLYGRSPRGALRLAILVLAVIVLSVTHSGFAAEVELRLDPMKVKGPDECAECHKTSVAVWKASNHATTFKTLPRSADAKKIAKAMGIRRIKSKSVCLTCHFTSALSKKKKKKVKPIAGITCESCHGAGAGWIDVHSDFGVKGKSMDEAAKLETPEHKAERYKKSEAGGMIRPVHLYAVANNCYECHTVPDEKLVNVGGHTPGSDFELVSWSQGEVRHNVWYSKTNKEASAERKRMMYVVGKALDLEHALRGLAKATADGKFATAMANRAKAALGALTKISSATGLAEVKTIVATAGAAQLKPNNAAELGKMAEKISTQARGLAEKYDGSGLAGIDAMIPGPEKYKGKVAP